MIVNHFHGLSQTCAGYEVRGMDHVCHGHSEGFRAAYGLLELEVLLESWTQYILQEIVSLQGAKNWKLDE